MMEDPPGHLSIDTLTAYHRGVLSSQESAQVRGHVILCSACQRLLLDLARFLDDTQGPGDLTAEEVEETRRRLEHRLKVRLR